ncbi:long-chain-fatty-acid--CoA ligase ACSBG2-like isoform X2 [Leptidea sinapis]|uniref:long-chain-fatty-acid--CoA ligase n=1 Tax=Leptidea sinapis TaxID=189913 RepID=A0A5E4QE77_9NEOP|nr:long-chain-fatty-acid--CoA ligase ACSBG2-like isoform X2 [Leptidea sinapis]VVC96583.1 unnamed protein product [Leptidea sinapis]
MLVANGIENQKYLNGPDQIIPAEDYINWRPGGHVKLRIGARGTDSEPPISVPGLLNRTVARYPDEPALFSKRNGKWESITYREYRNRVRIVAKAFIKLGLERFNSVGILGFNSEEWYVSDLAAIHAGGYVAGIYTTNSAEACFHCLNTSRANICVVQDKKQLDKVLSIKSRLGDLRAIIQWEGNVDTSVPGVYSWQQVLEIGAKEPDTQLDYILKTISINECCTLVYTSGTVGQPKAVMLTHDSLTWNAYTSSLRVVNIQPTVDRIVSYLPLSHVAAQIMDIYITLANGVPVYFAQPDALKGSLVQTLKEVRPTRFMGVPRVWEKMHEQITAVGASRGSLARSIAAWARDKGTKHHLARINGYEGTTCGYKLAKKMVFNKLKESLGFDNCQLFVAAAAPLSPDVKKFFLSLDIPILDAFGMSEVSGPHTLTAYPKFREDGAGELLEGTETKLGGSESVNGPGELMIRGRHVFMGYLNDEEKTRAAFDSEGWLLTGDIGRVDSQNMLYITGRIKDLLITAGGENIAPVLIEQTVQAELPHVGYAVLVGDKRKFLAILLTLKGKIDPSNGDALDELDTEAKKWVSGLGSKAETISEIVKSKDPLVHKAIEDGINRANKKAISNAQKVQKFSILPADFSVNSGELGPTLKIKRNVVYDKYKDVIENFYRE